MEGGQLDMEVWMIYFPATDGTVAWQFSNVTDYTVLYLLLVDILE